MMKKTFIYFALLMLLSGCSQDIELAKPTDSMTRTDASEVMSQARTRSLNGAIYNEAVNTWMIPQEDPYSLENFQRAYDNLATGKSSQVLSKALVGEFHVAKKLSPTHYALKIYPRNEEERIWVETMKDVQVSYIPFIYAQLTQDEINMLPQAKTAEAGKSNAFTEKSPYTVTYDNMVSSDGCPVKPEVIQLPVLYTVWPVEKPLPENLEYVVDYEVLLPHAATKTNSTEVLTILQNEAQMLALGHLVPAPVIATSMGATRATRATYWNAHGRYAFTDNGIFSFNTGSFMIVPMANLKACYRVGSNTLATVTDNDGRFSCRLALPADDPNAVFSLHFTIWYESPSWKITDDTGSGQLYQTIMTKVAVSAANCQITQLPLSNDTRMIYNVHRAANYFFNVQTTPFSKTAPAGGLNIRIHNYSNPTSDGSFRYNRKTGECYINIYNNNIARSNSIVLGTTLHELGHYAHYLSVGIDTYDKTHNLLKESFASYSGWYLGEAHLKSIGWSKPSGYSDITGQARQNWQTLTVTSNPDDKYYSPLFIDLTDSHNQYINSANFPLDVVEGAEPFEIWNIIKTSENWAQCKPQLESWAELHYSGNNSDPADLYKQYYLGVFTEWFKNNPY